MLTLQSYIANPKNFGFKNMFDKIKSEYPEVYANIDFNIRIFKYNETLSQQEMGISDGETIGLIDENNSFEFKKYKFL